MNARSGWRGRAWVLALAWILGFAAAAHAAGNAPAAAPAAYQQLHVFEAEGGLEGFGPYGALMQAPDDNFYGTGYYGGKAAYRCLCLIGGTVYRMTAAGKVTMLHTFSGADGIGPGTGLTSGGQGLLVGTTRGGGAYNGGTAFQIDPQGNLTTLHSFGGPANDGVDPYLGSLLLASDGYFYGTTTRGGAGGFGVAFKMSATGDVTVLHAFTGGTTDGATPRGGLMLGFDGNLYGTTLCGGAHATASQCGGTLYRLTPKGQYVLVYSFDPSNNGGYAPQAAPTDIGGTLYGTTSLGGSANAGTIWSLPLGGGALTTLHAFGGGVDGTPANTDGLDPVGRLAVGNDGRLYGTTSNGGTNTTVHPDGDGTLFSIGADGTGYTVLYAFGAGATDGSHPIAGLFRANSGVLYGSTETDGTNHTGTLFSWTPTAP